MEPEQLKKLKHYGIITFLILFLYYLGGVFVSTSFNISEWDGIGRFLMLLFGIISIGFYIVIQEHKQ